MYCAAVNAGFVNTEDQCCISTIGDFKSVYLTDVIIRDVKVSRAVWSRNHFFGFGLGLAVIGLGLCLMR